MLGMYSIVVGLPQLHQAEAPWSPKLRWRSASSSALAACDLRMLIVLHDKTPINGGNKPFITYQRTAAEGLFTSQAAVVRHLLLVAVLHQVLILRLS